MKKQDTPKTIFPVIVAIVAFMVAVVGGYLFWYFQGKNVDTVSDNVSSELTTDGKEEAGSVDVSLRYAGYVTLHSDESYISLNFTNPIKSRKSLSLDIVANINDEDIVLAITDKLNPGDSIETVEYKLERNIPKGSYNGKFVVHFYNEDSGDEEIVNSEVEINVYVK